MLDDNWYTEVCDKGGSAFSLRIHNKLHEETTPYQTISIYDTECFGRLMVIDDCVMLTSRDNFIYHEMMSHPALMCHGAAKRVLIIGGGDCGTLREVLKHATVTEAVQIEIDERVTRLSEQYFPELTAGNHDPRVTLQFGDGIRWVEDSPAGHYDMIIIDSTDPVGPAVGLFSEAFYRSCFRSLATGGILVQQSESPLYHLDLIERMHQDMKQAGFSHIKLLNFPQCVYPSGWWSATLAGKQHDLNIAAKHQKITMPFQTDYYNPAIHEAALACPEFIRRRLG